MGVVVSNPDIDSDDDITSWAAVTRASGFDAFAATPSSANLRALVTDESGSGALLFANGALGTPSSGVLTNATGLPILTGVAGLGTGVATALAVNVGSAGAPVVNGGAGGTPSSLTLTNATGLPVATGISGLGTGIAAILALPATGILDNLAGVRFVSTYAALTALTTDTGLSDNSIYCTYGRAAEEDGGFGFWRYDSGSSATANSGTILAIDGGGAGRFFRLYNEIVSPEWFGAIGDGTVDDTSALQAAINTGESVLLTGGKTYKFTTTLTVSTHYQMISGDGVLKPSGAINGVTVNGGCAGVELNLTFNSSVQSAGYCVYISNAHRVRIRKLHIIDGFSGLYVEIANTVTLDWMWATLRGAGIVWYGADTKRSDILHINFAVISAASTEYGLDWNGNCHSLEVKYLGLVGSKGAIIRNAPVGADTAATTYPAIGRFDHIEIDYSTSHGIEIAAGLDYDFVAAYTLGAALDGLRVAATINAYQVRVNGGKFRGNGGYGINNLGGVLLYSGSSDLSDNVSGETSGSVWTMSPRFSVDATFYATLTSSNPVLSFDTNDYIGYTRSTNEFNFFVGGASVLGLSLSGNNPILAFDANDYLSYNRTTNAVDFIVGGVSALNLASGAASIAGVAVPTISSTDTLSNKTLSSPTLSGTVAGAPAWTSAQTFPTDTRIKGANPYLGFHAADASRNGYIQFLDSSSIQIVNEETNGGVTITANGTGTFAAISPYAKFFGPVGCVQISTNDSTNAINSTNAAQNVWNPLRIAASSFVFSPSGGADQTIATDSNTLTLSNKTLSSPTLSGTVSGSATWGAAQTFAHIHIGGDTDILIYESATNVLTLRAGGSGTESYLSLGASGSLQINSVAIPTISSTDTLSNKTLASPTLSGTVAGSPTWTGTHLFDPTSVTVPLQVGPAYNGGVAYNTGDRQIIISAWTGVPSLTLTRNNINGWTSSVDSSGNYNLTDSGSAAFKFTSASSFQINGVAVPTISSTDTLSNKTISSPTLSGTVAGAVACSSSVTAQSATAIPAGGTAGAGLLVSSTANFGMFFGSGAPTLTAAKGSLYLRSDGSTTNDRAYVNTDGGTTWTALITAT